MPGNFVVVQDKAHKLLADLARTTPLVPLAADGTAIDIVFDTAGIGKRLPPEYFALIESDSSTPEADRAAMACVHNYFSALDLDSRCASTERIRISERADTIQSAELVAFGVGALMPLRGKDGKQGGARIYSEKCTSVTIVARTHFDDDRRDYVPVAWEPTNLVYGDAYGELHQLFNRRGETQFMAQVVQALQGLGRFSRGIPDGIHPNLANLHRNRLLSTALWEMPPANPEELVDRVHYILTWKVIETSPRTIYGASYGDKASGVQRI